MSAVIDKLAERQDQFIDLMVQWQKPFVAGLRRTASVVESQSARLDKLPSLPTIPGLGRLANLPGVDRLSSFSFPTPEELLRNQFAFAERVLETNKRFALSLATLGETSSKARTGTAPKAASGTAPKAASGTTAAAARASARRPTPVPRPSGRRRPSRRPGGRPLGARPGADPPVRAAGGTGVIPNPVRGHRPCS